jgi:hypothetical protein
MRIRSARKRFSQGLNRELSIKKGSERSKKISSNKSRNGGTGGTVAGPPNIRAGDCGWRDAIAG